MNFDKTTTEDNSFLIENFPNNQDIKFIKSENDSLTIKVAIENQYDEGCYIDGYFTISKEQKEELIKFLKD